MFKKKKVTHHTGGMVLTAFEKWKEGVEFCVSCGGLFAEFKMKEVSSNNTGTIGGIYCKNCAPKYDPR